MFNFLKSKTAKIAGSSVLGTVALTVCSAVSALAAESPTISYYTVDGSIFDGLITNLSSNVSSLMPYGITILGIFIGVRFIPRAIRSIIG